MKRVLVDECLPARLHRMLRGCDARSVRFMGWLGVMNGRLLDLAEKEFDVLLTADQNLPYQQSVKGRALAVVVLPTNLLRHLEPMTGEILLAVENARAGEVVRIALP